MQGRRPGDGQLEVGDRLAEQQLERAVHQVRRGATRHARAHPAQQLAEQGYGVVPDAGRGGVAGLADRDHAHRVGALLADADGLHGAPVGQRQPFATALVDRQVGPDVRPGLEQPAHADVGRAVLLVRHREQPQVAPRPEPRPRQLGHRHRAGRHLVLHVDRAASPQEAGLVDGGGEGGMGPVPRVGRHDVGLADERERRRPSGAGCAGHQVGPVGVARDQLAVDAGVGEVVEQVRRRAGLVARLAAERGLGGVASVEADSCRVSSTTSSCSGFTGPPARQ